MRSRSLWLAVQQLACIACMTCMSTKHQIRILASRQAATAAVAAAADMLAGNAGGEWHWAGTCAKSNSALCHVNNLADYQHKHCRRAQKHSILSQQCRCAIVDDVHGAQMHETCCNVTGNVMMVVAQCCHTMLSANFIRDFICIHSVSR